MWKENVEVTRFKKFLNASIPDFQFQDNILNYVTVSNANFCTSSRRPEDASHLLIISWIYHLRLDKANDRKRAHFLAVAIVD